MWTWLTGSFPGSNWATTTFLHLIITQIWFTISSHLSWYPGPCCIVVFNGFTSVPLHEVPVLNEFHQQSVLSLSKIMHMLCLPLLRPPKAIRTPGINSLSVSCTVQSSSWSQRSASFASGPCLTIFFHSSSDKMNPLRWYLTPESFGRIAHNTLVWEHLS